MKTIPAAISHGGADSPNEDWDGPKRAVDAALATLESTGDVLAAAVAGTRVLEDDPRFNAGTGARIRLDGESIQLDAALMHSDGRFGAVAALERVQNPILVAREVLDSPHLLVVGDGATRLARRMGLPDYDPGTDAVRASLAELRKRLEDNPPPEWRNYDWRRAWNYERALLESGFSKHELGTDTVGCVVRDDAGKFAAALSTGGTATTLRGRVGDVPVYGAGLYAGPEGAIACTGDGEHIVTETLARMTYEAIRAGQSPQAAADEAIARIKGRGSIGLILLTPTDLAASWGTHMAWAGRDAGSGEWRGPLAGRG
jgi:beta-aspartyl-peptidase (threonine type)